MISKGKFLQSLITVSLLCLTFTMFATPAFAAYTIGDEETNLKIGGLLQLHGVLTENGAPDKESIGKELFLRRMRLMLYGQLNKWVNFFVETDNPNFGKNGDFTPNTFIQDAYLELNLHPMLQIDMGMLLVPFSHQGMQGATTLLGLDYHISLVKYPTGSNKIWRDFGIMLRGMFTKWVEYRVAVLNGVHGNLEDATFGTGKDAYTMPTDPRNQTDAPRFTGRLTFNLFDPEGGPGAGGFFYDGIYISDSENGIVSTKKVLSVGGSIDFQPKLNVIMTDLDTATNTRGVDSRSNYLAAAGDVFLDLPIGEAKNMSINGQANFYYYNFGDRSDPNNFLNLKADITSMTGIGVSSELGFRYGAFEPIMLFDFFNASKLDDKVGDFIGIYGGLNYWLFAHSACFKLQVGGLKEAKKEYKTSVALQGQLLF